ncbi:MAG TPA: serine/threonine-protein kinase [Gemmataceae bacterium]|jgi:serine/threonine-protein kinase
MSSDPSAKGPRRNIRIGKYEVLAHVATGGMGAVYKARDTDTGQEVALKVLSPEMAAKRAMVERFRREATHAAKLRHENVVTFYEFGAANKTIYLTMEFIDGIDLAEYCARKGRLDPDEALNIIMQGCRALDHAYQCSIVHRDIKPSNFLLTGKGDRLVVKLTDLGLARDASNEEFRVTRAGTTVGTLDYMAPEQARDSGLADIRSDLYSLGSTWYHLLAGHAPFPKGGLGERLNRIMNEEPPDIQELNPRVSDATAAVLRRLMAKKPRQRYQTPAELLRDLESLARGERPLSSPELKENRARDDSDPVVPSRRKGRRSDDGRRTPRPAHGRSRPDTETGKSTAEAKAARRRQSRARLWYSLAGVSVLLLVASLVVMVSLRRKHEAPLAQGSSNVDTATGSNDSSIPPVDNTATGGTPVPPTSTGGTGVPPVVKKPNWPALYQPTKAIDAIALRKEIEAPWAVEPKPSQTVELVVGRLPPDASGKTFRSLAAACKAIPAGATGILELRDNGPFFDVPAAVRDRSVILRAAKGYRPLLVWDVPRTLDENRRNRTPPPQKDALVFLDVKHGNLTLQGVHLALGWPEAPSEGATVLRVEDGDLTVADCTLSVVGRPRNGVTVARLTATPAPGKDDKKEEHRCRFTRCYVRGAGMSVFDLDAPGASVLFDNCLLAGGDAPLLQVRAEKERPTRLRAVRSTMICGKNLLNVRPATAEDRQPAFDWLGWDVLLSRWSQGAGGELLRLEGGAGTEGIRWRAVNSLYAGWDTLLAGPNAVSAANVPAWRQLWGRTEGDVIHTKSWPTAVFPEPAELPASTYRTADSTVAFAASTGTDQLLGCDLDRLPPLRDNWLSLTVNRFAILAPNVPDDPDPPAISAPGDGLYHGERLDLNQIDLGAYLKTVQKTYRLAPKVVLHLAGSGERFTTPIRIKGSSLVLYFEPPPEKTEPLTLAPAVQGAGEAIVEIEQGDLDIINGSLRFAEAGEARILPWLVKVRGGDVRLFRTHLEVPPRSSGASFRGLVLLEGSGETAADRVRTCAVNESVLLSAYEGIRIQGIGARLLLTQTLLIAASDAVRLTLDPGYVGKANAQCLFDHTTIAGRASAIHLPDVKQPGPPAEPVVVQTRDCGFLNLFGRTSRPSFVLYEGEALAQGLLVWQGEGDTFDRRLWFGAASAAAPLPDRPEDHASWIALWGSSAFQRAQINYPLAKTLDADRWALDGLAGVKIPGADLEKLGIRKAKKMPR